MNSEPLKLNQVRIGRSVRVVRVLGEGALRQRILDMVHLHRCFLSA